MTVEPTAEAREQFPVQTLYDRVHNLRSNGSFHGAELTFGKGLPESRDERQRGDRSWN